MNDSLNYPFPAVIGNESVKKALICAIVNEELRGVLITGKRGTAKSLLLRSVTSVLDGKRVNHIPQNITDDRLFGSIDIEKAVGSGNFGISRGILAESNRQMIISDDINLLDERIIHGILNTCETKNLILEREGFSETIRTHYIFAAAMDPEEGGLSPMVLDRFDLCADTDEFKDEDKRKSIIKNCLMSECEPEIFIRNYLQDVEKLKQDIACARERLPYVMIPESLMEIISEICLEMNVSGQRGDIALAKTAQTLAALDKRDNVIFEDVKEAALLTLQHRRRDAPASPQNNNPKEGDKNQNPEEEEKKDNEPNPGKNEDRNESQDMGQRNDSSINPDITDEEEKDNKTNDRLPPEQIFSIGSAFEVIDYLNEKAGDIKKKDKSGNRSSSVSPDSRGHYISYRNMSKKKNDIAVCPSIRAAAPHQKCRKNDSLAISVQREDLREKVRERKTGNIILFLVDASGSMGAAKRMVAVKGAILSLLNDAYQKRDQVGLMVFRKTEAELLLPPTKSTELAYKMLRDMPTGGRTPLSKGIIEAVKLMTQGRYSRKGESKAVIILTDGRVNVSESGKKPYEELSKTAKMASKEDIMFIVVDTEEGFPRIGFARTLACDLGATYLCIDSLNKTKLANSVKDYVYRQVQG